MIWINENEIEKCQVSKGYCKMKRRNSPDRPNCYGIWPVQFLCVREDNVCSIAALLQEGEGNYMM